MPVFILIVIVIIILIIRSNNKEKERREQQRRTDAQNIRTKYDKGYREWKYGKNSHWGYYSHSYSYYQNDDDEVLAHRSDIIKLHEEIIAKQKVAAQKDEIFEKEQKNYTDKCYDLSKKLLDGFGRYHYDVEWHKNKPDGGWSDAKFTVWQFFSDAVCLDKDLDYTYRNYENKNADNIPSYQNMVKQFLQSDYEKINKYIEDVAKLSSRPVFVILINVKLSYTNEWLNAIDYHLKPIKRDVENTIVTTISELDRINISGEQIEHVIVIDVYTQNKQIEDICRSIDSHFMPSHAAISYISLLKCYDKNEMKEILEKAEQKEKQKKLHTEAEVIKKIFPQGFARWKFTRELNGNNVEITDQMILDAAGIIIKHQRQFKEEGIAIINKAKNVVSKWDHLTSDFSYKYLLRYYPTTCEFEATDEEWEDRYIVWNFKYNPEKVTKEDHKEAMSLVINNVKKTLIDELGKEVLPYLTLVCIPASSMAATERRFQNFSEQLCKSTGIENAYTHIKVIQDAIPKHLGGDGMATLEYDNLFFKDKNVIIFDDVITKGNSMLRMKNKMEELGATVIAGISIGKTFHHRPIIQSTDEDSPRVEYTGDDLPF